MNTKNDATTTLAAYEWPPTRIDVHLTSEFDYSRNFFHQIIKRWGIAVNDKPVKKSYKLQAGDVITIDDLQRYLEPVLLEEAPDIDIPIVYETEDILIINKPKGVLSHPNSIRDVGSPSVVGFLYHKYKSLPSMWSFIRAGLIHRLDKETDGLMIIAKTEKWLAHFKELFAKKSEAELIEHKEAVPLKKFYRATCRVTPEGQQFLDTIEESGLPYLIDEDVIPHTPRPVTKRGITKILDINMVNNTPSLLKRGKGGDLVTIDLEILTGRTHQIRYHLSNHGLPIVGDYLYGIGDDDQPMALAVTRLEFLNIDGSMQTIEL